MSILSSKPSIEPVKENACGAECEVFSRCCGYYRPVARWNLGKKEEFKERLAFNVQPKCFTKKNNG